MADDIFGDEFLRPMDVEINELIPGNEYKVSIKTRSMLNPEELSFKAEYIGPGRGNQTMKFYVYETTDPNDDENKVIKKFRGKLVDNSKYEVNINTLDIKNIENIEESSFPVLKGGKKRRKSRRKRQRKSIKNKNKNKSRRRKRC